MPIKSYILHCKEDKKEKLLKELLSFSNCEVIPAQNKDVIILVSDTDTEESDKELYNKLLELQDLKHLSLVSGFESK
jgi:nitrate reductase NapAB chaperone NapD